MTPGARIVEVLRLRRGRRHLQLRDEAGRRSSFPEAVKVLAAKAGVELDERTTREDARKERLREVLESAIAFYHAVLTGSKAGAAGPRVPPRPGLHRRDDRQVPAGLRAGRLGHARPAARRASATSGPRSSSRRARPTAPVGAGRRLRPVPRAGHLPDPRRERDRRSGSVAGSCSSRRRHGSAQVPELAGDAAVRQEPDALPHRQGEGGDPEGRPGGDRGGLYRRADGSSGRVRQGRGFARDGADPGPGRLLTRYAKRIALAYDVDAAGEKAGTFGATALESMIRQLAAADTGVELDEVRVVRLPDGKDPDEVVRETPDLWREEVRRPADRRLPDRSTLGPSTSRPRAARPASSTRSCHLRAVPNPVMRDAYLQTIHKRSRGRGAIRSRGAPPATGCGRRPGGSPLMP